ncbi:hypothetical protein RJY19_004626 [Vibrio alginolyticus]|nr:hypothetical protein [Vibrio alginolyticus]
MASKNKIFIDSFYQKNNEIPDLFQVNSKKISVCYFIIPFSIILVYLLIPNSYIHTKGTLLLYKKENTFYAPYDGTIISNRALGEFIHKDDEVAKVSVANYQEKTQEIELGFLIKKQDIEKLIHDLESNLDLVKNNNSSLTKRLAYNNKLISHRKSKLSERYQLLERLTNNNSNITKLDMYNIEDKIFSMESDISKLEKESINIQGELRNNELLKDSIVAQLQVQFEKRKYQNNLYKLNIEMQTTKYTSSFDGLVIYAIPPGIEVKENDFILKVIEQLANPIVEAYLAPKSATKVSRNQKFLIDFGENIGLNDRFHISTYQSINLEEFEGKKVYRLVFEIEGLEFSDHSKLHGLNVDIRAIQ